MPALSIVANTSDVSSNSARIDLGGLSPNSRNGQASFASRSELLGVRASVYPDSRPIRSAEISLTPGGRGSLPASKLTPVLQSPLQAQAGRDLGDSMFWQQPRETAPAKHAETTREAAIRHSLGASRNYSNKLGEFAEVVSREVVPTAAKRYPDGTVKAGGTPFFFADCDEAGHSVSKIGEGLSTNTKGEGANPLRQIGESITTLQKNSAGWLQDSVLVHGPVDFGVSVVLGLPIIPLASLASSSGEAEMHRATREIKELKIEIPSVERDIAILTNVIDASAVSALAIPLLSPSGALHTEKGIAKFGTEMLRFAKVKSVGQRDRLKKLKYLRTQNKRDRNIGRFAMYSGKGMIFKSGDLGVKAAQMAVGSNIVVTAAAGFAGAVNVMVLNLITAISAVCLGAQFRKKSAEQLKVCIQENRLTERRMATVDKNAATQEINAYIQFQRTKGAQIEKFRTWFARLNRRFSIGAGLYAGAAVVGAVAFGLVAVGVAPFSGVAVIAIAVIAPIAGLIMAMGSQQFLTGHPRQAKYQENLRNPDIELDSHRLAALDLLRQRRGGAHTEGTELDLWAGFHSQISEREKLRQNFLADKVGESMGKPYYGKYVYTGESLPDGTLVPKPKKWQASADFAHHMAGNVRGRFGAAASFAGRALRCGSLLDAKESARNTWNESRNYLTKTHLKSWLNGSRNRADLIEFLKDITQRQLDYFVARLQAEVTLADSLVTQLGALSEVQMRGETPIESAWPDSRQSAFPMANEVAAKAQEEDRQCRIEAKKILLENRQSIDFVHSVVAQSRKVLETFDDLSIEMEWLNIGTARTNGDSGLDPAAILENSNANFAHAIDQCSALQSGIAYRWNAEATLATSLDNLAGLLMDAAPARYRKMRGNLYEGGVESARQLNQWNHSQARTWRSGGRRYDENSASVMS